ncbi:dihydrolipoamide acetyltransferase family protein [Urbifossiella limnaea]|uniref:Dihydrolipoamide acetyltransferase component of pyruvate dehydrogenase complex n=1 Tax=Urbifossiella limnaea TaxID=2528023 RepID=A0A517XXT5_9BACT|nr:dihydrolipoamide acetyltransferase family protein [Urbifossiella limnaea]QDU22307.1 Dihydrolipoyllysine-residue acetyltransferase component of pyruvate dehydrogenase complex [Urbifossiella limnaea]
MDFPLPPVGEGLIEVELVRWLVKPGDAVGRGQGLAEVMSDKATMEVPAPFAGTITSLAATPGAKVQVGQVILAYSPGGTVGPGDSGTVGQKEAVRAESRSTNGSAVAVARPPVQQSHGPTVPQSLPPASPSVRLLARKFGVDLARVRGTGPHGRILLDDLTPLLAPAATPPPKAEATAFDLGTAGTRTKLVGLRRRIADHMVESKRRVPHYSYIDECDVTDLVRLRAQLREPFARTGVKLTYLAFVVKAVARALKEVPIANSTLDEAGGEIVLHDRVHVGVAVATPGGLIVPVVKDADKKDLPAVAADIDRLGREAKAGRARPDDLKGGTFTVTSVGNVGGLISTPIVNYPEVGILGVGKVVRRPVYDDAGRLHPADILYLSISFDHRVVDGAVGAVFGNAVARHLRSPATLLLPENYGA